MATFVARRYILVFIMALPPEAEVLFVAPARCAIEPLIHAPETVEPARVCRVCVVHDAVVENERAHAGRLAPVSRPVGSASTRDFNRPLFAGGCKDRTRILRTEVVFDGARPLLLFRAAGLKIEVEVAAVG